MKSNTQIVLAIVLAALLNSSYAYGQEGTRTTSSSVTAHKEASETVGGHHYNSPAERAHDDLLITEVKSALIDDGVAENHPVQVDCDHGTIYLSGVVASPADARRAEHVALAVPGVVGVNTRLSWP